MTICSVTACTFHNYWYHYYSKNNICMVSCICMVSLHTLESISSSSRRPIQCWKIKRRLSNPFSTWQRDPYEKKNKRHVLIKANINMALYSFVEFVWNKVETEIIYPLQTLPSVIRCFNSIFSLSNNRWFTVSNTILLVRSSTGTSICRKWVNWVYLPVVVVVNVLGTISITAFTRVGHLYLILSNECHMSMWKSCSERGKHTSCIYGFVDRQIIT